MRDIGKCTKEFIEKIPPGYDMTYDEAKYICDHATDRVDAIYASWILGFMCACRAAQRGRLDFQQEK